VEDAADRRRLGFRLPGPTNLGFGSCWIDLQGWMMALAFGRGLVKSKEGSWNG
jgi:hypothetical protein